MGKNVTIIDYGLGNLRSVVRGIEAAGARAIITGNAEEIAAADGIVLPGVGAFHEGMEQLGLLKETVCAATKEVPLLGICLGMQMLMDSSEEHGTHQGLGLIPGCVRRFPHVPGVKVPHMGWNTIRLTKEDSPLFAGLPREGYVYFVHSYYADTTPEYTLTTTDYIIPFTSSIVRDTVYGVQFHPEKSGALGLQLLKNFIGMV
ncbi:MAG: imidazole glycerol phosphate synthase subunit HisH [Methanoregula sp.]|jgi:glutamine amidotransferase|uniref:imidazole glycerol phosphate synthase subunit HisH n=1 Tax=Methanoregula sp. TaxID=2052170 RepID=UPI003C24EDF5